MGNLLDYYIVESVVDYDNDPLKIGRIKCTIPGVIHSDSTPEEGMPWIRCFRMGAYQTFSRPNKGNKVWVLVSKTNYNEFWYMPFHETIDITQDYIKEYYDENCDVLHARHSGNGDCMVTYDDEHGYNIKIGDDHINLTPKRQLEIDCEDKRIEIYGHKIYIGDKNRKTHEKTIMGEQHQKFIQALATAFGNLEQQAQDNPLTWHLTVPLQQIQNILGSCNKDNPGFKKIYTENTLVN